MAISLSSVKKIINNIDTSATAPNGTSRLNFNNYLYATKFFGDGSGLTGLPSSTKVIPFTKADGTASNLTLANGYIPFTKADGTISNLAI